MQWYIAKYVPDLARFEPRNVGVIVFADDGTAAARFLGERAPGDVDGRSVRVARDLLTYKAWVDSWRRWAERRTEQLDRAMLQRRAGDQYFLVEGGRSLFGQAHTDASELVEQAYRQLVGDPARDEGPEETRDERVWNLFTRGWKDPALSAKFVPKEVEAPHYSERFEHVWTNDIDHIVHPLALDLSSVRAIQRRGTDWSGRIQALEPTLRRTKADLAIVLGMPPIDSDATRRAAEDAAAILRERLQGLARVVPEAETSSFARELEAAMRAHG